MWRWIFFLIFLSFAGDVRAGQSTPLLYRESAKGSTSNFNPLSHYLNLTFDTLQNPFYFSQENFFSNHEELFRRVTSPASEIAKAGGFGEFLSQEFFGSRAIPNYTLHVIGGGYDFRMLSEWYEARGIPYPYVLGFFTSYLANIGNEAVEVSARGVGATDHIADLLFFDIAGKLLFLSDDVVRFFRDELGMMSWHFQPMVNVLKLRILNAGSNYVFRPSWTGNKVRPFLHMGMSILLGASLSLPQGYWVSLGAGVTPTDPLEFKAQPIVGMYLDQEGDLLSSLTFNGSSDLVFRLNIYPDVFTFGDLRPGFFAAVGKDGAVAAGINLILPVGVAGVF